MYLFVSPLLISALLGPILLVYLYRYRRATGAPALLALVLAAMIWTYGYGAEILSPGLEMKLFWAKIQYFGIASLPLTWILFAYQYLGAPACFLCKKKFWVPLVIISVITVGLVWTNSSHSLIWKNAGIKEVGGLRMLQLDHGPYFYFYVIFSYILISAGALWLFPRLASSNRILRWQLGLVITAMVIPFAGNLAYVTHFNPIAEIDWTPIGMTLAGLLLSASLFRFRLVEILPTAHSLIFTELLDGILILDLQDRVVKINPAARRILFPTGINSQPIGLSLIQAVPELASILQANHLSQAVKTEVQFTRVFGPSFYDLQILPLTRTAGERIGRLVVLHEITERKMAQSQLESANDELDQRVAERTEALHIANQQLQESHEQLRALAARLVDAQECERRKLAAELHDEIGQALTALGLNLKVIQNRISAPNNGSLVSRLDDSLDLVEQTTRQVRYVMSELIPPMLEEGGLLSALHWYGKKVSERTGINVFVSGEKDQPRLPARQEISLFRIAQEALNNVAKHAQATRVEITLYIDGGNVSLTIWDNGRGFDLGRPNGDGEQHLGLLTMKERAVSIGGQLSIQSAPNQGTCVNVELQSMEEEATLTEVVEMVA